MPRLNRLLFAVCLLGMPALALAQAGAPPGSAARPVQDAPLLPGKDGAPPPPRPSESAPTGGNAAGAAVRGTLGVPPGGAVSRGIRQGPEAPTTSGAPPPPKPGVSRATGDEDEMDDLDVQRRTAPSDLGAQPLATPKVPVGTAAPLAVPKAAAGTRPGSSVSRTTGDEDEMDDLDVQRRTAPSDLGAAPLPAPGSVLGKGGSAAPTSPAITAPLPKPAAAAAVGTVLPAAGSKAAAVAIATGSASLQTSQPVYATDQLVVVTYAGMPGSRRDWITIVPEGTPDDKYGEWAYLGTPSGTHRFGRLLKPGNYEVRAYENWPAGQYGVKARARFQVR